VRRYNTAQKLDVAEQLNVDIKLELNTTVGRCRLTVSKPELKALLVSALETKMR
jgi:hypothetical protein